MEHDISVKERKKSIMRWVSVVAVNVIIAATVIFMSVSYSINQSKRNEI